MVQTRSQARAQTNATITQSTKPAMQKATCKVARIPIKAEKEKDSKTHSGERRSEHKKSNKRSHLHKKK